MISGTFKPGVQSLKPGDRVRETSTATDFIADYIVLIARRCGAGSGDTVYKLYTTYTNTAQRCSVQMPGSTVFITESEDLFEGKSVQWARI